MDFPSSLTAEQKELILRSFRGNISRAVVAERTHLPREFLRALYSIWVSTGKISPEAVHPKQARPKKRKSIARKVPSVVSPLPTDLSFTSDLPRERPESPSRAALQKSKSFAGFSQDRLFRTYLELCLEEARLHRIFRRYTAFSQTPAKLKEWIVQNNLLRETVYFQLSKTNRVFALEANKRVREIAVTHPRRLAQKLIRWHFENPIRRSIGHK